jgi:hypothetical protein
MQLSYIKAKKSGLWFYGEKGEVLLIVESKDMDNLETAIKEVDHWQGKDPIEFSVIPMKPQGAN